MTESNPLIPRVPVYRGKPSGWTQGTADAHLTG